MLCHFYGWTVETCLDLPIKTFFAMHKQAVVMEARQYKELLDIALIPKMNIEYYFQMAERYKSIIWPEVKTMPPRPGGPVLESGGKDATEFLRGLSRAMKRNLGYDGRR